MMMSSLLINKHHTGMGKYVDINVGMYEKYELHFVRDPNKLWVPFVWTRKSYGFHLDKIRRIYRFSKYVTRNVMGLGSYGLRVNSGRVQNGSGSDTGCGALLPGEGQHEHRSQKNPRNHAQAILLCPGHFQGDQR